MLWTVSCSEPPIDPRQQVESAVDAFRRGEMDDALLLADEGRRLVTGEDGAHWKVRFDLMRAEILLARSRNQEEIDEANRLIAGTYEAIPGDQSLLARWLYIRAYALYKESKFEEAGKTLDSAVSIAREQTLPDVEVDALMLLGTVCHRMQEPEESERHWSRAFRIAEESGDRFRSAASLMNLGYLYMNSQRFDEAITRLDQAALLAREENAELLLSSAVGNLSQCWRQVGDLDRALEAALEAMEMTRRTGVKDYLCNRIGTVGQIHQAAGNSESAVVNLRQAVELANELQASAVKAYWAKELAATLVTKGSTEESAGWIESARSDYRELGDTSGLAEVTLIEASLAEAIGDNERVISLCEDVCAKFPEEPALQWRALARLASAMHRIGRPDAARTRYASAVRAIRADRERLVRLESRVGFLTHSIGIYRNYVALLLELGLEDEALRAIESSRAQTLLDGFSDVRTDNLDIVAVQRVARHNRVTLLSYWISPLGSFAWVIGPENVKRVPLPDSDRITDLVQRHKSVLEQGWRDPLTSGHPAGRELFGLLVDPVRELVPSGSRVVVVPDGPLHLLNFETLVTDEDHPHYLIEDWTVSIAPALALLTVEPHSSGNREPSILLVGDPVETDHDFPALPHASEELAAIAALMSSTPVDLLRGAEATPAAFLARPADRYAWLHFAAHAQAGRGNPLDSSVVLSPGPGGIKLYARDIVEHGVDADLVTLSACRSAGSRLFSGEGLVGFSWAFMRAGSSRVIAGLWDVSDRSTVLLMEAMYGELARGVAADQALREAKLRLLRSHSNFSKPFYWGPFQLYTRTAE